MATSSRKAMSVVLTKGLTTSRIHARADHSGGSNVPLMFEMSGLMRFLPWIEVKSNKNKYGSPNDFDNKVTKKREIMGRTLAKDGCKPGQGSSSSSRPSCDGTFRHKTCIHDSCGRISYYKLSLEEFIPGLVCEQENQLYTPTSYALNNLRTLAARVEPNWIDLNIYPGQTLGSIKLQKPDYVVRDKHRKCLFAVEGKHPRIKLRGKEERIESNPNAIAMEYAHQFRESVREYEDCREDRKEIKLDALQKAIIQTCFCALSVDSGLPVLTTMNEGVFFQASPRVDSRGRILSIDMYTSRVYDCNPQKPGEASLMDALFLFLTSSRHAYQVKDTFTAQKSLARAVDDEKREQRKDENKDEKHDRDISLTLQGSAPSHQSRLSSTKIVDGDDSKSKRRDNGVQRSFVSFLMSQLIMDNVRNLPNRFENVPREKRIEMLRKLGRNEYWMVNIVELEDMFMKNYYEVIGEGASGTALRADAGEFGVAIKILNVNSNYEPLFECDPTPLDMLQSEISVYKWIAKKHPELLGNVIPRLYAVLEDAQNENDTAFVTEYVGEKVIRHTLSNEGSETEGNERFEWYVDGARLSAWDITKINEAATEALGQLLERGIVHQDLREDNLRVERIVDDEGHSDWRAWWVDLGIVRIEEGKSYPKRVWELGSREATI